MDRVNLSPPTTAADVASVKHGTLHVTRYLRQRWRPEWQRGGLSPTSVQGTFSHLMALRKLQDLERRGEVPEHAGQINRPANTMKCLLCAATEAVLRTPEPFISTCLKQALQYDHGKQLIRRV